MLSRLALFLAFVSVSTSPIACGGVVDEVDSSAPTGARSARGEAASSAEPITGMPCALRHGSVTLRSYRGDNYASSAFSFRYASQDQAITRNDYDVLYEDDVFIVNMVTDDRSFVVDLGPGVALSSVPRTVEPARFASGQHGAHDEIEAHLGHTYVVRSVDGAGRRYAAFTVTGLSSGRAVTLEWIRSSESDALVVPHDCGL